MAELRVGPVERVERILGRSGRRERLPHHAELRVAILRLEGPRAQRARVEDAGGGQVPEEHRAGDRRDGLYAERRHRCRRFLRHGAHELEDGQLG